MYEIFTVEEQIGTAFSYEANELLATWTWGGKVGIVDGEGNKGVGFILEERRKFWKIKLKFTNEVCHLKSSTYIKRLDSMS